MPENRLPAPFVVGVERSGTTLLRLMLDAHSDLAIPSETHFLHLLRRQRFRRISRRRFLAVVVGEDTFPNFGIDEDVLRRTLRALRPFTVSDGLRSFYKLYAERFGKSRWGDKTPPYAVAMSFISTLLPEAHFVNVIRDGRDVAVSLRPLWFGPGEDVAAQARHWVRDVKQARRQSQRVPHYAEVRFEDLVREPEESLRRLCAYLALPFESRMLAYHETAASRMAEYRRPFGPPGTPSEIAPFVAIHERVTKPPDPTRVGRWRTELTGDEQRRYEAIAGPLLRELGYETT